MERAVSVILYVVEVPEFSDNRAKLDMYYIMYSVCIISNVVFEISCLKGEYI